MKTEIYTNILIVQAEFFLSVSICFGTSLEVLKEFMLKERFIEIFTEEIYLLKTKRFLQTLVLVMWVFMDHVIVMKMRALIYMEFCHMLRQKFCVMKIILLLLIYIRLVS